MRRGLSIFALILLLAPLALPLAGSARALPICCRPGGSHHCSGSMTSQARPGDGFREAAHKCPYSHATLLPNSLRPQAPATAAVSPAVEPLRARLVIAGSCAPVTGVRSSRAPPLFSSL
jgi:hypothetical protein